MNRQVKATHISLLVHGLLLWGAVVLNQYAQPIRPPVVLDFSILAASGGPAEDSQPAATPEVKSPPSVEKKVTPKKPVVKNTPQQQAIPKKTLPAVAEKTPPVETVPVAANTDASPTQNTASAESAAQSSAAAQTPGNGQAGGGGSGGIFSVGQLDAPLTALAKTPPAYPPSAKRQNIEGWIKVKFVIDEHGQVGHVSVLAAEPQGIFEQSVLRCISNWRFKPGTVNGLAVKALVEQTIAFKLEG